MTAIAYLTEPDGTSHRLDTDATTLGREAGANIVIAASVVSRIHAVVTRDKAGFCIADDASRNGTFVNGAAIGNDPVRLDDGDVVVLGGAIPLTFRDPNATPFAPRIGRLTGVWINPDSSDVWVDARLLEPPLSPRQLTLLRCLDDADGDLVSRAHLVDTVWADAAAEGVSDDALTGVLKRLRSRLDDGGQSGAKAPSYIEIVRHHGVRLRQPEG